jgi:competence protein ComEA
LLVGEEVPRPVLGPARSEWGARWHAWRGDRRIAAALLACVAVAAGGAWLRSGTTPSAAAPAVAATGGTNDSLVVASTSSTRVAPALVVDVVGAVRRAGVVRVRAGARVVDAIEAAGGASPDADLTRLNLAAPVVDGSRIAVPRVGAPAPPVDPGAVSGGGGAGGAGGVGGPAVGAPVNLNSATAEQLDTLPGIGPATAAAIISDRDAHGPFRSVNDLGRVRGIGDAKLDQLRDLVTV